MQYVRGSVLQYSRYAVLLSLIACLQQHRCCTHLWMGTAAVLLQQMLSVELSKIALPDSIYTATYSYRYNHVVPVVHVAV